MGCGICCTELQSNKSNAALGGVSFAPSPACGRGEGPWMALLWGARKRVGERAHRVSFAPSPSGERRRTQKACPGMERRFTSPCIAPLILARSCQGRAPQRESATATPHPPTSSARPGSALVPLTLTPEMILVLGLVGFTMLMLVLEWIRADMVALLVVVVIGLTGVIPSDRVFNGFAGNAVIAIIAIMIMGEGLDRAGVLNLTAHMVMRLAKGMESRLGLVINLM